MISRLDRPINADLGPLLRQLQQQVAADDLGGQQATVAAIGASRVGSPLTIMGALCLGGADFAAQVVSLADATLVGDQRHAVVLDAFCSWVEAPRGAPADYEARLAEWLIRGFELNVSPKALLDLVRAEFLITAGPIAELPEAVLAGMRHQDWHLALRGLVRLQESLQDRTPRNIFGMAAVCLHKLARYEEAELWAMQGLGSDCARIAQPPVHTETELMSRWGVSAAPIISIVCTTYNHERYVERALRGFLSQNCPYSFEILIHDDASTDRTQDIIRDWQSRYPNLIKPVLQTENQLSKGVRPFELLLARATGEFVACCEGDDFWIDPTKLARQVGFLKANPAYSCSAHNYLHYIETSLTVRPWTQLGRDFFLTERQLMGTHMLLWLPTLVFRRSFTTLPPERALAAFGDQFLTSYLGTMGRCIYFETLLGAVRRENEFSMWSPLPEAEKERRRVKTWIAMVRMHESLGNSEAVTDLMGKVAASRLDAGIKAALLEASAPLQPPTLAAA